MGLNPTLHMYKLTFSTEIGILLKNNWIEMRHRRVADVKSDFLLAIKKNHIRWQMRSKKHKLSLLLIRKKYDNVYIFYVQLNKCVYLYLVLVFFFWHFQHVLRLFRRHSRKLKLIFLLTRFEYIKMWKSRSMYLLEFADGN